MDQNWVDYQAGNLLTAGQLNEFETWQLYVDQEISDAVLLVDGATIRTVMGEAPITIDASNTKNLIISIDETQSFDDPNLLISDTAVMSEKAIDAAFGQIVGTGDNFPPPGYQGKVGKIKIDPLG